MEQTVKEEGLAYGQGKGTASEDFRSSRVTFLYNMGKVA